MVISLFNQRYNYLLSKFGRLRVRIVQDKRWGINSDTELARSCRLFLCINTLSHQVTGGTDNNLSDEQIEYIFHLGEL